MANWYYSHHHSAVEQTAIFSKHSDLQPIRQLHLGSDPFLHRKASVCISLYRIDVCPKRLILDITMI